MYLEWIESQIRASASKSDANIDHGKRISLRAQRVPRAVRKLMKNVKETESNECDNPEAMSRGIKRANEC